MNNLLKQSILVIASLTIGYLSNGMVNTNRVTLENTRSGFFVIHKSRIFQLYELSNHEPDFVESLKDEKGVK